MATTDMNATQAQTMKATVHYQAAMRGTANQLPEAVFDRLTRGSGQVSEEDMQYAKRALASFASSPTASNKQVDAAGTLLQQLNAHYAKQQ